MKSKLTQAQIEARFAKINAQPPETLSPEEEASLQKAEAMDDGSSVDLDQFAKELEDYSGRIVLRLPRSLHKALKEQAAIEGVSLNQYMLYKLSR